MVTAVVGGYDGGGEGLANGNWCDGDKAKGDDGAVRRGGGAVHGR